MTREEEKTIVLAVMSVLPDEPEEAMTILGTVVAGCISANTGEEPEMEFARFGKFVLERMESIKAAVSRSELAS